MGNAVSPPENVFFYRFNVFLYHILIILPTPFDSGPFSTVKAFSLHTFSFELQHGARAFLLRLGLSLRRGLVVDTSMASVACGWYSLK